MNNQDEQKLDKKEVFQTFAWRYASPLTKIEIIDRYKEQEVEEKPQLKKLEETTSYKDPKYCMVRNRDTLKWEKAILINNNSNLNFAYPFLVVNPLPLNEEDFLEGRKEIELIGFKHARPLLGEDYLDEWVILKSDRENQVLKCIKFQKERDNDYLYQYKLRGEGFTTIISDKEDPESLCLADRKTVGLYNHYITSYKAYKENEKELQDSLKNFFKREEK